MRISSSKGVRGWFYNVPESQHLKRLMGNKMNNSPATTISHLHKERDLQRPNTYLTIK